MCYERKARPCLPCTGIWMTALLCSLGGREGMGTTQGVAHALTVRVVCVCLWALTLFSRTASLFAGCLWYMCLEQSGTVVIAV